MFNGTTISTLCALGSLFVATTTFAADLEAKRDAETGQIHVFRVGDAQPIVTQNARDDFRPYLHPIVSPDGKGVLTEYSPGHHRHQTGLYWGFTRVNGRDFFHHPEGDYWRKVSADVIQAKGHDVIWRTVYDMLDADGQPIMRENADLEDARARRRVHVGAGVERRSPKPTSRLASTIMEAYSSGCLGNRALRERSSMALDSKMLAPKVSAHRGSTSECKSKDEAIWLTSRSSITVRTRATRSIGGSTAN